MASPLVFAGCEKFHLRHSNCCELQQKNLRNCADLPAFNNFNKVFKWCRVILFEIGQWVDPVLVELFQAPDKVRIDTQKSEGEHEQAHSRFVAEAFGPRDNARVVGAVDDSGWRWPMPRSQQALDLKLTPEEKERIGKKVWNNECSGTKDGLTTWNKGEEFPSLGIGHFIWMPKNAHVPFGESFPQAMRFVESEGAKLPAWLDLDKPCPWESRKSWYNDFDGKKLTELRNFLANTVPQQTDYLIDRLEKSLPEILNKEEDPAQRDLVQKRFYKVLNSGPGGVFALVDYVNFKGEGLELVPQYNNHAWGLRQVLEGMKDTDNPLKDFSDSAKEVLKTRVANSPPERNEKQWLPGWLNRVDRYVTDPPFKAEKRSHQHHR